MQKVSIRLPEDTLNAIKSFALAHGMSRSAAIEFFTKFGVGAVTKQEAETELKEDVISLRKSLKAMHEALYASAMYSNMAVPDDAKKFAKAKELSVASANQIFDQE